MAEQVPLPRLTEGYLGKQSKFDEYGLSNVSHPDPVVYMADDQTEVSLQYVCVSQCDIRSNVEILFVIVFIHIGHASHEGSFVQKYISSCSFLYHYVNV